MKKIIHIAPERNIPDGMPKKWLFFFILLAEGASVMAVELIAARLVAPFYGNSLYVWTAVLCFSVTGLAFGYYAGGKLTRRYPFPRTLLIILAVSSLLVFMLPGTARAFISLTSGMELIPGISLTVVALLVPPLTCFGMVGPLAVRLMSSTVESTGKVSGKTYFISTFGGILATFIFGIWLIPLAGVKFSAGMTAAALALFPLINIASVPARRKFRNSNPVPDPPKTKEARQKKGSRPVTFLNKVQATLYLFAAVEGAAGMILELLSARMLAPWYGSSLHVWAVVMGVTLLGLATGYFLGGRFTDKYPQRDKLLYALLGASVFILLMHLFSRTLPPLFQGLPSLISLVIISLLLILPPLTLLGMIPILLIRHITREVEDAGMITGRVFTISSLSGIIMVPLTGFWIIPEYGLTFPSILTGLAIGTIPFILLVRKKINYAWFFLPVLILSLVSVQRMKNSSEVKIQYFSEGLLGQVMVADVAAEPTSQEGKNLNGRMLFVNRMGQSQVDLNSGSSQWNYLIFTAAISSALPEKSTALVLGLGGGMMAEKLSSELGFEVDAVELDSRIAHVSRRYFGLNEKVNVFVDDARHYMEISRKKYDLIFFDVFRGEVQPAHVLSLEAFKKAGTLLSNKGMIIVNFNGYLDGKIGLPGRSVFATLNAAGFETRLLPTPGEEESRNSLFVASKNRMTFSNLRTPLAYHGKEVKIDSLFLNPGTLNKADAKILTDNKPLLEWLNIKASDSWRKDYTLTFTKLFTKFGIPLFE